MERRCRAKTALDLAVSLWYGNIKPSWHERDILNSVLNEPCSFISIVQRLVKMWHDGTLCDRCQFHPVKGMNICEPCGVMVLVRNAEGILNKEAKLP